MNKEKLNKVLVGLSHTGYTTELERCEARLLLEEQDKEIERLNNIIKEVREFAKLRKEMYKRQENVVGQEVIISLLNVLDKGE